MAGQSIYRKIWDEHIVRENEDGSFLLYVDSHLLNEATSPQAFAVLRQSGRSVRKPEKTIAVTDRAVSTEPGRTAETMVSELAKLQIQTMIDNCHEHGIVMVGTDDQRQGIIHVMGAELGFSQPGNVVVCGDSHTSTLGAFGALAFGIGTSEVEHVLATQTIRQKPSLTMKVAAEGSLPEGVFAKDVILSLIGKIGTSGATGYALEYAGSFIEGLSMEGRMTICNMSIEAGARCGMISPDDKTLTYLEGRAAVPKGKAWEKARATWPLYRSDPDAIYDRVVALDVSTIAPQVTWGTSPQDVVSVTGLVPVPDDEPDEVRRGAMSAALAYMDLAPGCPVNEIAIHQAFIGSCTNGRLEDLLAAAAILKGRRIANTVKGTVVPGSRAVRRAAEELGLHRIFIDAGFDWRESGCSMCVALNGDRVEAGQRCVSTSNRNFPGRQGFGSRTHLMSPAMVAASAVAGHITDVREFLRT